ncbi:MAG: FtsX-like permease family protein [Acidimicrobiia bacterium]
MTRRGIYWRWSWRDLRHRWIQVSVIAFIIALGTGMFTSLESTTQWRVVSQDNSYAATNMYDLKATLAAGSTRPSQELEAITRSSSAAVTDAQARLIQRTQVDASTPTATILVPGRIVGYDVTAPNPIATPIAYQGRTLSASDRGTNVAVVDEHFLRRNRLTVPTTIAISGGTTLQVVGGVLAPEYFYITGEQGSLIGEDSFAVIFTSIETAQRIANQPNAANDVVATTAVGTDNDVAATALRDAFARALPTVGTTVDTRAQDPTYALLYKDIQGDQRFYRVFALVILLGAAFAAFNLTSRIVESQRREIGIGMALGESPGRLAIRPLLIGMEVALLGALAGLVLGGIFAALLAAWIRNIFILPIWNFPIDWGAFARGAALGFALPVLATLWPVWRAVRVPVVDAIHTGPTRVHKNGGMPAALRIVLPLRRTTSLMPFRNVVRSPRRTLMTALGIAAAIVVLVSVIGMLDSFFVTIRRAETELLRSSPDRMTVTFTQVTTTDGPEVRALRAAPAVDQVEPTLTLGGTVLGRADVDVLIAFVPLDSSIWRPTITRRVNDTRPGIVLTEKAARDVGVRPGDTVRLRHPYRDGPTSYRLQESDVVVLGINPTPTRFVAFMPPEDAALLNMSGLVNTATITPPQDVPTEATTRALFETPGVASVQPIRSITASIRNEINRSIGFLNILRGAVLLLALLIAFNTASINTDERARDHATMFAFGLRLRTLLSMNVIESIMLGILGTAIGILAGWALLGWMIDRIVGDVVPDIAIDPALSRSLIITAFGLGVLAVGLAPLLTIRRLRRMDIPSTLRVVE